MGMDGRLRGGSESSHGAVFSRVPSCYAIQTLVNRHLEPLHPSTLVERVPET
jgi:hypothetical protein